MNPRSTASWRSFLVPRIVIIAVLSCASAVLAIQPGHWTHTTEADFEAGETEDTVVTNLGDVKLATGTSVIAQLPEDASIIYDMQRTADGTLYLATGPEAKVFRFQDDEIQEVLELEEEQVFALAIGAEGALILGISGSPSRLATLQDQEARTLVELQDVRYIWDVLVRDERIYVATGTDGKVFRVDPAGDEDHGQKVTELLDAAQANVLCLGQDDRGDLYAGTDTDGLVYRIRPRAGGGPDDPAAETFVLYDAPEPEIGALLVLGDGTVFAGTADADQARPGRLEEAAKEEAGRPLAPAKAPDAEEPREPAEPVDPGDLPQVPPKPEPQDPMAPQEAPGPEAEAEPDDPLQFEEIVAPGEGPSGDRAPRFAIPGADRLLNHEKDAMDTPPDSTPPDSEPPKSEAPEPGDREAAPSSTPTPQQRDRLREVIRARLQEARKSGVLQGPGPGAARPGRPAAPGPSGPRPVSGSPGARDGNAVYRIEPSGFVHEVFRESAMILSLANDPTAQDRLLVATGNEGQLYLVDLAAEETTILADLEPQQIPAILVSAGQEDPKGRDVLLGTANPAQVLRLDRGFAAEGSYTSSVLDASQISLWGKVNLTGQVPGNTSIQVQFRSGNVEDPDQAAWAAWSEPQTIEHDAQAPPLAPRELEVPSPPARFLQYRFTFQGDGTGTAVADRIDIAYVMPNLKPRITSIQVTGPDDKGPRPAAPGATARGRRAGTPSEDPEPQTVQNIQWEASDPNGDDLTYTLEYRAAGSTRWLPLAENVLDNRLEWDTRRVPDGRYLVRIRASDAPHNTPDMAHEASRQSDPVLIDNTPPVLEGLQARVEDGVVRLTATVRDALSTIHRVQYAVDSTDDWQAILPEDLIFDSTSESVAARIPDLSPGGHVITVRAFDAQYNSVYHAVTIEVND